MKTKQWVLKTTGVFQWIGQRRDAFLVQTGLLMVMRMMGTGLGFFFWMYATRSATPNAVGQSSALISAAMFMASIAQMGLGYVLLRHLRHHPNPSAFVHLILCIIAVVTVVLSSIAIATMNYWFPQEASSHGFFLGGILFLLTVSLALSQIINWIFLAQQRLRFSLLKQVGQACIALGLIVLLRPIGGFWSIMLAYTIAAVVVTVVSIGVGLPRTIPAYQRTLAWNQWPPHALVKDALPNYLADQLQRLPDMLLPLMVVHQAGTQLGAVFFIMWSLGSSISTWASSTADAFLREGTYHPQQLMKLVPRVLTTGVLLTLSLGGMLALVSPIILPWYGQMYATLGHAFLLLLLLGNIPWVGTTLLLTFLRIQERPIPVLLGLILSNGLGSMVMIVLLPYGLTGTGWGWFSVQMIVMIGLAAFITATGIRHRRHVIPRSSESS